MIHPEEICYLQVTAKDVPEIVSRTIKEKQVVDRLLYEDPSRDLDAAWWELVEKYQHLTKPDGRESQPDWAWTPWSCGGETS